MLVPARLGHFLLQDERGGSVWENNRSGRVNGWIFPGDWHLQSVVQAEALARGAALPRRSLATLCSSQHGAVLQRQRWHLVSHSQPDQKKTLQRAAILNKIFKILLDLFNCPPTSTRLLPSSSAALPEDGGFSMAAPLHLANDTISITNLHSELAVHSFYQLLLR